MTGITTRPDRAAEPEPTGRTRRGRKEGRGSAPTGGLGITRIGESGITGKDRAAEASGGAGNIDPRDPTEPSDVADPAADTVDPEAAPSAADDAAVIEAVLRGEIDRYGELVDRYQLAAWRLAFCLVGNLEDAKDLSQNGFVKAYRGLRRFRGEARFSTWLYRIVANECKDFLKSRARGPFFVRLAPAEPEADEPDLFEAADPGEDPREAMENKELAGKISRAIERLPFKQRLAFILCQIEGLALEAASGVMGIRLGTVKAHLFRATERLRKELR